MANTDGHSTDNEARLPHPDAQPYSARLAGAGSRLRELQALLQVAGPLTPSKELRTLVVRDNVAGKASAASREKVWGQLKVRYALDPCLAEYRAFAELEKQRFKQFDPEFAAAFLDPEFKPLILQEMQAETKQIGITHPVTLRVAN